MQGLVARSAVPRRSARLGAAGALLSATLLGACHDLSETSPAAEAPRHLSDAACQAADVPHFASALEWAATVEHGWTYEPMPLAQRNALTAAVLALDAADLDAARAMAAAAAYDLAPAVIGARCAWVVAPTSEAPRGQATLVVATSFERQLVIEAPHVPEDHSTGEEAAMLFDDVGAKALIVSGAHRCASTVPSGCRPNGACSSVGRAAESDSSHSVTTALHAMHLGYRKTPVVVLQLHTNKSFTKNGDILVSNGTSAAIPGTYADAFYDALHVPGVDVRGCNDPASPPPDGAFCGETNVQSLASNGAEDACTGRPSSSGGASAHRFVHVEQSYARMDGLAAWEPIVAEALIQAVPADP